MSDWIVHRSYKYIKKTRGKNGKWRYWYKNTSGRKKSTHQEVVNATRTNYGRELDLRVPHGGSPSITVKSNGVIVKRYPDGFVEKDKKQALAKAQSSYKKAYDWVQKYRKLPIIGGLISFVGGAVTKNKRKKLNDIIID